MNRLKSKTVRWAAISRECSFRGNGVVGLWFWSGSTSDGCMCVYVYIECGMGMGLAVWE